MHPRLRREKVSVEAIELPEDLVREFIRGVLRDIVMAQNEMGRRSTASPRSSDSTRSRLSWPQQAMLLRTHAHNRLEASCAPSAKLASFAHTTPGSTRAMPTQVPKPQSVLASTRSVKTGRGQNGS